MHSTTLSERVAWEIALTWQTSLQNQTPHENRVTLKTDRSGVNSKIVPSYQWIQFDFDRHHDAMCGRASVIVWFWLSCCEGYSGHENPSFWKRVFCELVRPPQPPEVTTNGSSSYHDHSITDAIRFFDVRGNEFPRVQFEYVNAASTREESRGHALRHFLGLADTEYPMITQALKRIFKTLKPHLISFRMQRTIPVSLHKVDFHGLRSYLKTKPSGGMLMFPQFEPFARIVGHQQWTPELRTERVRQSVPNYFHTLFTNRSGDRRGTLFSRIRLERDRLAPNLIPRVCSMAPHSRTIDSLNLKTTTHRSRLNSRTSTLTSEPVAYPEFSRLDWAWIGYALFHPAAQGSVLRHLKIGLHGITREAIQILKLMKAGNHLHCIAAGSLKPASTFYHMARLRKGSIVRRRALETADSVLEAQDDVEICLCVDQITDLAPWVRVVAPGIGLTWIRSSDIASVTSRAPSTAQLTSLEVSVGSPSESTAALAFARVVGTQLRHLDISACADLGPGNLRLVLEACPLLKSLCLQHDGSLWAGSDTRSLPQIEELSLNLENKTFCTPSVSALQTSLRSLAVLRLESNQPCVDPTKDAVQALLQVLPTLQYFYWSDPAWRKEDDQRSRYTYEQGRACTQELLQPKSPQEIQALQAGAFLSLVERTSDNMALASLNQDVIGHIVAFTETASTRTYWVGA